MAKEIVDRATYLTVVLKIVKIIKDNIEFLLYTLNKLIDEGADQNINIAGLWYEFFNDLTKMHVMFLHAGDQIAEKRRHVAV